MSRQTIEKNQEREQGRYEAFEFERRRTDQITDASEKLAAPMRNTFAYYMTSDGHLWFQNESIGAILDAGIARSEEVVREYPQFVTELIRNRIERQEYDDQRRLALGGEDDPDILMVASLTPDAVLQGEVDLGAYDTERKKILIRIAQRTKTGIEVTSLSLDRGDREGLSAVVGQFGGDISDNATSEDILAMRFWAHQNKLSDEPIALARTTYDKVLKAKYGGKWYAGRQHDQVLDAMEFIEAQPDLIRQHMAILESIDRVNPIDKKAKIKQAEYNFIAALSRRQRGDSDLASIGDAGAAARANGEVYKNDCPDAENMTARASLNRLGFNEKTVMNCPYCGFKTIGDPCASHLVCNECAAEVKDGKVVSKGIGRANVLALKAIEESVQKEQKKEVKPLSQFKLELAQTAFGAHVSVRYQLGIGTGYFIAFDTNTGEDIASV